MNADIAILDKELMRVTQTCLYTSKYRLFQELVRGTMTMATVPWLLEYPQTKDNSQGVVGIAPGARLWSVKVLDRNGEGFVSDIIKGIDYVTDHKNEIDSVNLQASATMALIVHFKMQWRLGGSRRNICSPLLETRQRTHVICACTFA